jgi:hypothetical protein
LLPPLGGALPGTLFDGVRDLVLEALAATQWPGFLQSPQFTTYLQYKALEVRPATLDDFVFYRVLGRGEFAVGPLLRVVAGLRAPNWWSLEFCSAVSTPLPRYDATLSHHRCNLLLSSRIARLS